MSLSGVNVALFVMMAVYLTATGLFARRLRERHYSLWEEHGSFLIVANNTPRKGLQMFRFIWSRTPRQLDDRPLSALVLVLRILSVLIVAALLALTYLSRPA